MKKVKLSIIKVEIRIYISNDSHFSLFVNSKSNYLMRTDKIIEILFGFLSFDGNNTYLITKKYFLNHAIYL